MSGEPKNVGPIEGREVYRDGPPPYAPPAAPAGGSAPSWPPPQPPDPTASTAGGTVVGTDLERRPGGIKPAASQALHDIRHSRGKDVPNSRPVPEWMRKFAWFLDDSIPVPGTNGRHIGVDGVIALVPVAGDVAGLVMSMSIVLAGVAAGVTIPTTLRMLLNVGYETVAGLVPFGGVVFDMAFKSNMRNVRLIEKDLSDRRATRRSSLGVLFSTLVVAAFGVLMLLATTILATAVVVWILSKIF